MLGTLVIVFVSFIIFMSLMKAVYFDPILRVKEARERKLVDDRDEARNFEEEFQRIQVEYEAGLKKARQDAHHAIQEIRQQAKGQAAQAITQARAEALAEMDRRVAELTEWREKTYREMEAERENLKRIIVDKVTTGRKIAMAERR